MLQPSAVSWSQLLLGRASREQSEQTRRRFVTPNGHLGLSRRHDQRHLRSCARDDVNLANVAAALGLAGDGICSFGHSNNFGGA
jgi:hypothetical protein